MSVPARIAHVVYRTRRFQEMIDWYRNVFGARVQFENEQLAFLSHDEEHHRFAIANLRAFGAGDPPPGDPDPQGLDHVAFTMPDAPALLEQYARLKKDDILPYWAIHHGLTLSLYYRDPDGNGVEFQVDCFDSKAEGDAYIRGSAFRENPIGARFDPEELLARLREGEDPRALLAFPETPAVELGTAGSG